MENICRTCLKKSKRFLNIFEHFRGNKLISDTLMECTSVETYRGDGLPISICYTCLEKLNAAYDFRILVIESYSKLRSHHNNTVKIDLQQNNYISVDFPLVKEENSDLEIEKLDLLMSGKLSKSRLIEDTEEKNVMISYDQACETIEDKVIDDNLVVTNFNVYQDKNLVDVKDINEVMLDNLHDNNIKDSSNCYNDCSSIPNDLIISKEENQSDSISNNKESNLDTHTKLPSARIDKSGKAVFCDVCNRSFAYRYYFEIHVRYHTGDMPFKCDICNKGFAVRFMLNIHMVTHSDNRPYSCEVCGKGFKYIYALQKHKTVHSKEMKFKCEQCSKTFKYLNSYKLHISRHQKDRKYVCEICGRSFIDSSSLTSHKVSHKTEKDHECPTCGKMFPSKGQMKKHLKLHSEEKPHVCGYCNRRFHYKKVLRNHILIHTGEKPFTCKICAKQFRQAYVLKLHMRTHTGETPYSCNVCPCKFKYSHLLRNHAKVHNNSV